MVPSEPRVRTEQDTARERFANVHLGDGDVARGEGGTGLAGKQHGDHRGGGDDRRCRPDQARTISVRVVVGDPHRSNQSIPSLTRSNFSA